MRNTTKAALVAATMVLAVLTVSGSASAELLDSSMETEADPIGPYRCIDNGGGETKCWSIQGGCYTVWNDDDYNDDYTDENAEVKSRTCVLLGTLQ